jgi:hypothetical protein
MRLFDTGLETMLKQFFDLVNPQLAARCNMKSQDMSKCIARDIQNKVGCNILFWGAQSVTGTFIADSKL